MDLTQLLAFTVQNNASDLHLSPKNPPIIRVDGDMKRLKADPLTSDGIRSMLYSVMTEEQRTDFEREFELDFSITFSEDARFRVNIFTSRNGTASVLRIIPSQIPSMEELGLPPVFHKFSELERGLVLVTGPTGSGKSTTLAALINHINETRAGHIVTIEDPVEFFHTSKKCLVNHREVGPDSKSFAKALNSALREDLDVILVGEMRDYETISLALTAAETGHVVFGTLHSNSAGKTVDRIIDVFPSGDKEMVRAMLAGSLQGVVAQALLKRKGGGRVAAHEILVGTNAVRNLIRENQIAQLYSAIQTGSRYGMVTMKDSIDRLLREGKITEDEARSAMMLTQDKSDDFEAPAPKEKSVGAAETPRQQAETSTGKRPPDSADGENEEGYSF